MKHSVIILLMISIMFPMHSRAQFVEKSTDVLCLVPTATAVVLTLVKKDEKGLKQFALSTLSSVALSYGLEAAVRKERPDGQGMHSMPSTHTTIAFSGASFLQRRYGWKWGAPAYALATYVAWGRVHSKRHDVWDVLVGTAIGVGGTYVFTRPFMKGADVSISPSVIDDAKCVSVAISF
jgi:membrane-associated phospholipid phosphatase